MAEETKAVAATNTASPNAVATTSVPAQTVNVPKGLKVLEPGSDEHNKETRARQSIPREKRYALLQGIAAKSGGQINGCSVDEYINFIESQNAQGKPVLCKVGNVNYLFQPTEKQKKEAEKAAVAKAEEKGFWERNAWLKWVLIGLGTAGLGFLAGYLIKKSKTKTVTKTVTESGGNTDSGNTPGIHDPDSGLGGNENGDGGNITTNTNTNTNSGNTSGGTLGNNSTPVDTNNGFNVGSGITWQKDGGNSL